MQTEEKLKTEKVEVDEVSSLSTCYVTDYEELREEIYTIASGEVHDPSWMYPKKISSKERQNVAKTAVLRLDRIKRNNENMVNVCNVCKHILNEFVNCITPDGTDKCAPNDSTFEEAKIVVEILNKVINRVT